MITKEQLIQIVGKNKESIVNNVITPLNNCLEKYAINNKLRICHFLAQVLHESGAFRYFEEIADGSAYESRKDLGNIYPGDGKKFKGRGVIQITGRTNYAALSKDFGVDFVNNPKLLANYEYGVLSAGWYWNSRSLNKWADLDNFVAITKKVNGGLNGLEDRKKWLEKCKLIIN